MQFAINYSPQAEALWRQGKIQVDLFKCPDWPDLVARVRKQHRVYVHCALYAGRGRMATVDLDQLQHWLDSTDTTIINTHFAALREDFAPGEAISADAIIERAVGDLEILGQRFGMENIVIENVPYPERGHYGELLAEVVEPAVIAEVLRRTGCGFLLDIAHALRVCEGTGRPDVKAYIEALPVQALRELHVVGLQAAKNELGFRRDHFPMRAVDWQLAEWAVGQIAAGRWRRPATLAFEYGGIGEKFAWRSEAAVIAAQAPRLYQLAQSV